MDSTTQEKPKSVPSKVERAGPAVLSGLVGRLPQVAGWGMAAARWVIPRAMKHRRRVGVAGGLGVVAVLLAFCGSGSKPKDLSYVVKRMPLSITVSEQGNVKAVSSQEIKCEVQSGRDPLRIIRIAKEGYLITEEDIRNKKVLVELDSSEVKRQIIDQDIKCEQAEAALADAQGNYDIQANQNTSDIKAAEQKARFTRMDFDKFLGSTITQGIIDQLGIEKPLLIFTPNASGTNDSLAESGTTEQTGPGQTLSPANQGKGLLPPAPIDFSKYADLDLLGDGEAKQKLRKLLDDLQTARKDEQKAITQLAGTRRLQAKDFVTKTELEKDDIDRQSAALKVQSAETSRDLFIKYEFQKTAEEVLSKYDEAVRELARSHRAAISKLAQVKGKLNSAKAQFEMEKSRRQKLQEQLDKCTIVATRPGLVVYGDGHSSPYRDDEEIKEGSIVREQQTIITIPDMSKMSVSVRIHESYIKKIKVGQKARVVADAFPDSPLEGEVTSVGVLPDSGGSFFNSEKVYLTIVTVQGSHDWLKPGMNAKVDVMVNHLPDALVVPIQSVFAWKGKQACSVAGWGKPDRRVVEIGEFNDEFIEIKSGLKPGEQVLLHPEVVQDEAGKEAEKPEEKPAAPSGSKAG